MYLNERRTQPAAPAKFVEPKHKMYLNKAKSKDSIKDDKVEPKHKMYLNNPNRVRG